MSTIIPDDGPRSPESLMGASQLREWICDNADETRGALICITRAATTGRYPDSALLKQARDHMRALATLAKRLSQQT